MSDLQERLARLTPEQRKQLLARLRGGAAATGQIAANESGALVAVGREQPLPLSFSQYGLWFVDQLDGGSPHYNEFAAHRLRGPLDQERLGRALDRLIARHESLRTSLPIDREGVPWQRVAPPTSGQLGFSDLGNSSVDDPAVYALVAELRRPFDLAVGPLLRLHLCAIGCDDHLLLLTIHHTISDHWSTAIFVDELIRLYTADRDPEGVLPPLAVQYGDYAVWQRARLDRQRLASHIDYWRGQLADLPGLLELPADRPRPARPGHAGQLVVREIGRDRLAVIDRLARELGMTRFMLTFAALGLVLQRYSGVDRLVIGAIMANRDHPLLERLIGYFINALPIVMRFGSGERVADLLAQVRRQVLDGLSHQEAPFEKVVEALRPERATDHTPIFQVALSYWNTPDQQIDMAGIEVESLQIGDLPAPFDLTLNVEERGDNARLLLEYSLDLFDRPRIERMADHLLAALDSLCSDPDAPLATLSLLTSAEVQQLTEWQRGPQLSPDLPKTLISCYNRHLSERPGSIALVCDDTRFDWQTIEQRSNAILSTLLDWRAVHPDEPWRVALSVRRSLDLYAGLLAILRSGALYLPLDPDYPDERLAWLIADSGASLLLAERSAAGRLATLPLSQIVLEEIANERCEPALPVVPAADSAAYMIFTSGSTGQPKGVVVSHVAWAAHIEAVAALCRTGAEDRIYQFSSASFDASLEQIGLWLMSGATLVTTTTALPEPLRLLDQLEQQQVTVAEFPPGYCAELVATAETAARPAPSALRLLMVGGDAFAPELANSCRNWLDKCGIINSYGPTEGVIAASCHHLADRPEVSRLGGVPIGRPLAGVTLLVVDPMLQQLPVGVDGELLIGREWPSDGYHQRPDLNRERFIELDVGGERRRFYRSGDRVRWGEDGELLCLGRLDRQIKLRGFRIEPGEIEAEIIRHQAVSECVVDLRQVAGSDQLVAYLVGSGDAQLTESLRERLAERLPAFMLPSHYCMLPQLPRTPTGKVDRQRLPDPELIDRGEEPLRGEIESLLASIWSDLLGVAVTSRGADFFALGGHSLLATRLVARIRDRFSVELPLRQLFETPQLGALAGLIAGSQRATPLPPIRHHNTSEPLRPGFAQQRLWFLSRLEGASATYNLPAALLLRGPLDGDALSRAVERLVERHDALRIVFPSVNGEPLVAMSERRCRVQTGSFVPDEGEGEMAAIRRLAAEDAARTFDLEQGPLLRLTLYRITEERHLLLVNLHHIIADGWSLGVLVTDLGRLYRSISSGGEGELAPLPIDYRDYIRWQYEWLQGERLEQEVEWWRQALSGAPQQIQLPTDRPRPPRQSYRGGTVSQLLPAGLLAPLDRLASTLGATRFMLLISAYSTLLHRYSGQDELLIGTPIANRRHGESEGVAGLFVNTVVVRSRYHSDLGFSRTVALMREQALAAYAHQDLPFEMVVEALNPQRTMGASPLFQVAFVLQNAPIPRFDLGNLSVEPLTIDHPVSKFDLTLHVEDEGNGLRCDWEYALDLFERETIERMSRHFNVLLEGLVSQPEVSVAVLPLLDAAELAGINRWCRNPVPAPLGQSIPTLFSAAVERHPQAVALDCAGEQLDYAALDRCAERLAIALRSHMNAVRGEPLLVAICAERSLELVVGILAILKAGAGYVPLDPDYPDQRLEFMLHDSGASLLLVQEQLRGRLPATSATTMLLDGAAIDSGGVEEIVDGGGYVSSADSVAYMIYTSGSTGEPKGVLVPHRAVVRLVVGCDYVELDPQQRLLLNAPITFDAATFELWGALLNGARLTISPPGRHDLASLGRRVRESGATTLWLTSSLFNQMVDHHLDALAGVHQLLIGGEALSPPHVRRAIEGLPGCRIINGYGPTENTTFSCCHPVSIADCNGAIPIGRPIANSEVRILDRSMQPVPVGVEGELYCGGAGVALGYHRRPGLTAARFVADPSSPGHRLYRTGDRVRWRSDGLIEYLGRFDQQIKLRGYRIEPGEIEARLVTHLQLHQAVVVVRGEGEQRRLVAFYTVRDGEAPEEGELRLWLGQQLPDYMVPARLYPLAELPLTPNGKVDLGALREPEGGVEGRAVVAPPLGRLEQQIAGFWQELLPTGVIGRDDDFFALGGHSLLATRLVARIASHYRIELPLRELFEAPTLASFAARVAAAARSAEEAIPARRAGPESPRPLSYAQQRLWFLHRLEPESPFYNVALAVRIDGEADPDGWRDGLQWLVDRHEVLRLRYIDQGGGAEGRVMPLLLNPGCEQLGGADSDERLANAMALARAEALRPFDLASEPSLRARLLVVDKSTHVLLLTFHHIVSDGWSLRVVMEDLSGWFAARRGGGQLPPPLPIQYSDFAVWQRQWLEGERLAHHLEYWRNQLAGLPPGLQLPTDRPRPAIQSYRGRSLRFAIDPAVSRGLKRLAQEEGATLFMVLLLAWGELLRRYSGQETIAIGTPIANRGRPELEGLIGFFVNTLVMRVDLAGRPGGREALKRLREVALSAYAHQDLPFERLVDELHPERDLSRNPLFQVMFALQNLGLERSRIAGYDISLLDSGDHTALFDLVLDMWEEGERLVGVLQYASDLFDEPTIVRMADHYSRLLESLIADPAAPLASLSMVGQAEMAELLALGRGAQRDYPQSTLHAAFEQQAAATPDAVAIVAGAKRVRYGELNRAANRLAHWLIGRGVGEDDHVAILLERGVDYLVALLATLKAGGCWIPIDSGYPASRQRHMLLDGQVSVVITRRDEWLEHVAALFPEDQGGLAGVVLTDSVDGLGSAAISGVQPQLLAAIDASEQNPPAVATPRSHAYTLYTSGSTGLPKGARIRHDGALNHILAEFEELSFHPSTAFLQSAPISSDISVWQYLGPLLIGGRVVVVEQETLLMPERLHRLIRDEQVTLIELVPAVLGALLDYCAGIEQNERELPALEFAMVTGEAATVPLVNRWFALFPDLPLINAYGPTEASDDVCQARLMAPIDPERLSVPIGRPLANLQLYVVDGDGQLAPYGVPGEICVSGVGVGSGYWRLPERSAESFVDNPWSRGENEERLYRTGDRGRWLADGDLEFIGRLDHQVKVRGYRIEPGEIEAAIAGHPLVQEAVVVDHRGREGDETLLHACLVLNSRDRQLASTRDQEAIGQVALWESLHEASYSDELDHGDPTFNVIGWDSNYTLAPLPVEQMVEYVEQTSQRILSLRPRRLLEIGCGTGLILFRIVSQLDHYLGLDLSSISTARLRRLQQEPTLRQRIPGLAEATIRQGSADQIPELESGGYDTAILPSVVQYFPGVDYLLERLDQLVNHLRPGGAIYLGDLRSLPLLATYHASVELFRADDTTPLGEIARRSERQLLAGQEMAVDPRLFLAIERHWPRVAAVEILPKRGDGRNEMTLFRYDVVIRIGSHLPRLPQPWREWRIGEEGLAEIEQQLAAGVESVALSGVINRRLERDRRAMAALREGRDDLTAHELGERLEMAGERGLEPEALIALADTYGYAIDLEHDLRPLAAGHGDGGDFHLLLRRQVGEQLSLADFPRPALLPADWRQLANDPLRERLERIVVPELRQWLRQRLPASMVPASMMVVGSLPLMPNGKVDRSALPRPIPQRGGSEAEPPQGATEIALAAIWCEVLDIESPGRNDDFFELGGHSLKATRVVSRLRRDLGVELPLRDLFSSSRLAELAAVIDRLAVAADEAIRPVQPAEDYPVSHAQRRLWVLAQMEPGASVAYNMPAALLLNGPLDRKRLTDAVAGLIARHESLRTRFVQIDGDLRQRIEPAIDTPLLFRSLIDHPDATAEGERLAMADMAAPFDLEQGPLLRLQLIALATERHLLLVNLHHIVCDDWSQGVLIDELFSLYRGESLPPLPIHYRDYAVWQNRLLDGEHGSRLRDYWLGQLEPQPAPLELPTDRPRPAVKSWAGGGRRIAIGSRLVEQLVALGKPYNATPFMLFTAVVKLLLLRTTGQHDFQIGTPVAGRDRAELEGQVGFYINTLILRDRIEPEAGFERLLATVVESATAAFDHQHYPFDRLVQELQVERDVSRSPLVDVVVVVQNAGGGELRLPGITVEPLYDDVPYSKFDLQFTFEPTDDGWQLDLGYNSDLFDATHIDALCRQWLTLAEGAVVDPARSLLALPLIDGEERRRLLALGVPQPVADSSGWPAEATLDQILRERAAHHPQRTALTAGDGGGVSYSELVDRIDGVAARLTAYSPGGGARVGIVAGRTPALVTAIFATLQTGAAYVPLDPDYPIERLESIIDDAGLAGVVVEQGRLEDGALQRLARPGLWICAIDRDGLPLVDHSSTPPTEVENGGTVSQSKQISDDRNGQAAAADDPAYIIYTSGSTGMPKGVVVTHRQVVRLFRVTAGRFDFGAADVWTLFHSYAFDFSVWELFGALLHGGRLVLVPFETSRSPELFMQLLSEQQVTILNQTPSAFRQLVALTGSRPQLTSLRLVIFGGEALDPRHLQPWFEHYGDRQPLLVNMYGITETTVHVTWRELTAADAESPTSLIGQPLPDLAIYLLDRQGEPVPVGVAGEIYVGGGGVANGYHRREQLTTERFITNPFGPGRLYRSGDLARWRADGELEYAGRADQQIKLRGFRIEPGEIEAVLAGLDGISEVVVALVGEGDGRQLAAWLVAEEGVTLSALRHHARQHLPAHMVPGLWQRIDRLPLTANGKLDQQALRRLGQAWPADVPEVQGEPDATPPGRNQQRVAAIFSSLLGVDRVALHDNFFDLGAHSLLLIQARQRLEQELGQPVAVVELFRRPTVASLASWLDQLASATSRQGEEESRPAEELRQNNEAAGRAARQREARARRRQRGRPDRNSSGDTDEQ